MWDDYANRNRAFLLILCDFQGSNCNYKNDCRLKNGRKFRIKYMFCKSWNDTKVIGNCIFIASSSKIQLLNFHSFIIRNGFEPAVLCLERLFTWVAYDRLITSAIVHKHLFAALPDNHMRQRLMSRAPWNKLLDGGTLFANWYCSSSISPNVTGASKINFKLNA